MRGAFQRELTLLEALRTTTNACVSRFVPQLMRFFYRGQRMPKRGHGMRRDIMERPQMCTQPVPCNVWGSKGL